MTVTQTTSRLVVGRQRIVDRDGAVRGFELLYRSVDVAALRPSGDQMTAHVVLGALSIGVDQLVGSATMFCNVERSVIVGESAITLPPERTVIEVLETIAVDDAVVAGCRRLLDAGFRIALDDFEWAPGSERLLELASIVKIDFRAVSRADLPALVRRCRAYDVELVAEKVETEDDVALARDLGFELFQGYAIERPVVVHGHTVSTSVLAQVQLAASTLSTSLDFDEIETVLRREPGLVIQVLEMAAVGAHHGMRRRVRSVREAMVLLGATRLRRWIGLHLLSSQPGGSPDGIATALLRARMVETLAHDRGIGTPDVAFTAGLLSCLDLLLGVEHTELATTIQIDLELETAAFHRTGPLGDLIREVTAYQAGIEAGDAPDEDSGELDAAAAAAFAWAVPYLATGRSRMASTTT